MTLSSEKAENGKSKYQKRMEHARELAPATSISNLLLEQSSLVCTNKFIWKKLLSNKMFASGFYFS